MTIKIFSDEQKRLSLWSRPSTYVGGPSVVTCRKPTNTSTNRARSADARCFGFGSGISRFTVIQSTPASPMVEQSPLFWYCKDIDIDGGGNNKVENSQAPRKRSRHDCHFAPGTSIPLGKNVFPGHRIFYPYFHFVALP